MMEKYFPYFVPAFLVAVGFIDPGNWVTLVEGGSRFGYELAWVVCSATLLAMLLQTVSARLGVVTGKHFAQVCREELPQGVCTLLWVLCEMSILTLDLTMVLGTAVGLNVVLRIPTLSSLLLMAVDSLIFIAVLPLMEMERAEYVTFAVVGMVLVCIVLYNVPTGTLPLSMAVGLVPKLRHETLYAAISIVGANVMPHNFYLHSALVKDKSRTSQPLSTLSNYCSWGTLYAFCAVLVVNLSIFSVAVAEFHNTGFVVLTLQDAQAFIEQILNNSICPAFFGLALLCAGQLSTLNGSSAGQIVSDTFLDYQIHPWQHRILIRGVSLVPVATCVYFYGNEGIYQMLMFSQMVLALFLPLTVAPLLKLTSSERIMGSNRNSFLLETVAWLAIAILSAVNVTLIFDLVFGDSEDGSSFGGFEYLAGFDWVTEIFGESLQSIVFGMISIGTTLSLGFLVWLIFTPLQLDTQMAPAIPSWIDEYARREGEALGTTLSVHDTFVNSLPGKITGQGIESHESDGEDLPLAAIPHDDVEMLEMTSVEEVGADSSALVKIPDFPQALHLDSLDDISLQHISTSPSSSSATGSPISTPPGSRSARKPLEIDQAPIVVEDTEAVALKQAEAEADADAEILGKDDDEMDAWGSLEQDNVLADALDSNVNDNTSSLQLDGPISGRSDTSFGSEGGSGSGSLSRISGLGRAARRQFALILDDFWATLFNLHGQPVVPKQPQGRSQAAALLDGDSRGMSMSHDGRKLDSKQQTLSWKKHQNASDRRRSMDSNPLPSSTSSQLPRSHSQDDGSSLDYKNERRYMSVHMPSYHEDYDYQPATIHGYRTPSFPGRAGNIATGQKVRQMHQGVPLFRSQTSPSYGLQGDTDMSPLGGEYNNLFDSRRSSLSSQWGNDVVGRGSSLDTRGSNHHLTETDKHLGESETSSYDSSQWNPVVGNGTRDPFMGPWDPLVYRATGELDIKNTLGTGVPHEMNRWANFGHSPIGRGGQGDHVESAPLVFDELSPSQSHRDAFSIQTPASRPQTQSLWSRQPFEQLFGATDADGLPSEVRKQSRSTSHLVQSSQSDNNVSAGGETELEVLENLQMCIVKLLRLEGSEWLFRRDNGADEDLITAVAVSQKKPVVAELSELHRSLGSQDLQFSEGNNRSHAHRSTNDSIAANRQRNVVPNCGKGCVWDRSLLVSFGVWCVHRVLELSLMESRPELWGKYTYVLNRLQGILEPAFSKPRFVPVFCRCISQETFFDTGRKTSKLGSVHDHGNGDFESSSIQSYPHPWPWGRNTIYVKGKGLSATTFLDMIKEVETAVGSRKGRTGTAAGDVAFPKGKENLASVLKRYKRRLSSKPPGLTGQVNGGRKV
ncbi:unnamed protein product [Calypogeia fissa]